MLMYKTETHLHTKPLSGCARFYPEEMVRFYHDAGYHTIFVSDHFSPYHFSLLPDLSWEEKTGVMYDSYLKAKAEGEKFGMNVLLSPELSLNGNHYLLYGVSLEFLNSRKDVFEMSLEEFSAFAKEWGITIIQAHPYRDGKCTPQPEFVDGFEVINTNPRHENFDEDSISVAKKYNKLMSAGSDAHRTEDIAGAAMLSECEIKTIDEYLSLLKKGGFKIMKHGEIYDLSCK